MMPPHLRPILRDLEAALRSAFGGRLRDVRLFGSYARGEANEDSDVDVLVLVDDLTEAEVAIVSDCALGVTLAAGSALAPLAPLPMATERFERMSATGRGIAAEIARDGAHA